MLAVLALVIEAPPPACAALAWGSGLFLALTLMMDDSGSPPSLRI